jgi:arsenate reductase
MAADSPPSVLFLCTGNSARSQMAEAVMNRKANGRFAAFSAGSHPAARVHPLAIQALRQIGIEWAGHAPQTVEQLARDHWDFLITVCDRAKEACPILPGTPIYAHWGVADPAEAEGTGAEKLKAFGLARDILARRIDLMLALRMEKLTRMNVAARLEEIGGYSGVEPIRPGD